MPTNELEARQEARENVDRMIDPARYFPEYVLRGNWGRFLFFLSDRIFDPRFVETAKILLQTERSSRICVMDLDSPAPHLSRFWIDGETTEDSYSTWFCDHPKKGTTEWTYQLSRYAAVSEIGDWCLYAEMQAEIGLLAVRDAALVSTYVSAIDQLGAAPIDVALSAPKSWTFQHMDAGWREDLLKYYGGNGSLSPPNLPSS